MPALVTVAPEGGLAVGPEVEQGAVSSHQSLEEGRGRLVTLRDTHVLHLRTEEEVGG